MRMVIEMKNKPSEEKQLRRLRVVVERAYREATMRGHADDAWGKGYAAGLDSALSEINNAIMEAIES